VAEEMKVPLFKIAVGQVRTDAESVKSALQNAFLMTKAWNGIILLDEADVFLERRSIHDLNRNQLVSGMNHDNTASVQVTDFANRSLPPTA
jgi:ATPase family associated with various cellular activities (AAA)